MSSKYNRRPRAACPDGGVTVGIDCGGVTRGELTTPPPAAVVAAADAAAADASGEGDRFEMLGGAIVLACSDLSARIPAPFGRSAFGTGAACGTARPSLDVATLIFLWLTRIPRCAISALSTLRTVCF